MKRSNEKNQKREESKGNRRMIWDYKDVSTELTSMLHCRADSYALTEGDLDAMYNEIFSTSERLGNGKLVMDLVHEQAADYLTAPIAANFEHKIVHSIATRLAAETVMLNGSAIPLSERALPGIRHKSWRVNTVLCSLAIRL